MENDKMILVDDKMVFCIERAKKIFRKTKLADFQTDIILVAIALYNTEAD